MSFTQGLSGLSAASKNLEVIGNNVANANTVGFKQSQAQFGDLFAAALSGAGASQIGIGVKLQTVAQQFTQGNVSVTNNVLDMAVNGPGFFVLDNGHGIGYSRNGQFQLNKDGFIVSSSGHNLQGYAIDPLSGKPIGSPTALTIPTVVASAVATGKSLGTTAKGIVAGMNLDSRGLPPLLPTNAFKPTDPNSYNSSTSTTTYDSKGVAQTTSMFFVKKSALNTAVPPATPSVLGANIVTAGGVTTVSPLVNSIAAANLVLGAVVQGGNFPTGTTVASLIGPAGGPYTGFTASANPTAAPLLATNYPLTIDVPNNWQVYTTVTDPTSGAYLYPTAGYTTANGWVPNGTLTFNNVGLAPSFSPNLNAPTPAANTAAGVSGPDTTASTSGPNLLFAPTGAQAESFGIDFSTSTQFGATFGVNKLTQDGYTSGQLSGFSVSPDGSVMGRYSNGVSKALGQVVLATFPNMQGLQPLGSNEWAQTPASGSAVINAPGSGNNGVLQTSATEDSNTDLTAELVNMITAQRVYQANAQTIKTQDAVMQTLINLR